MTGSNNNLSTNQTPMRAEDKTDQPTRTEGADDNVGVGGVFTLARVPLTEEEQKACREHEEKARDYQRNQRERAPLSCYEECEIKHPYSQDVQIGIPAAHLTASYLIVPGRHNLATDLGWVVGNNANVLLVEAVHAYQHNRPFISALLVTIGTSMLGVQALTVACNNPQYRGIDVAIESALIDGVRVSANRVASFLAGPMAQLPIPQLTLPDSHLVRMCVIIGGSVGVSSACRSLGMPSSYLPTVMEVSAATFTSLVIGDLQPLATTGASLAIRGSTNLIETRLLGVNHDAVMRARGASRTREIVSRVFDVGVSGAILRTAPSLAVNTAVSEGNLRGAAYTLASGTLFYTGSRYVARSLRGQPAAAPTVASITVAPTAPAPIVVRVPPIAAAVVTAARSLCIALNR